MPAVDATCSLLSIQPPQNKPEVECWYFVGTPTTLKAEPIKIINPFPKSWGGRSLWIPPLVRSVTLWNTHIIDTHTHWGSHLGFSISVLNSLIFLIFDKKVLRGAECNITNNQIQTLTRKRERESLCLFPAVSLCANPSASTFHPTRSLWVATYKFKEMETPPTRQTAPLAIMLHRWPPRDHIYEQLKFSPKLIIILLEASKHRTKPSECMWGV